MHSIRLSLVLLLAAAAAAPAPAAAQIAALGWHPVEVVEPSVTELSSPAGAAMVHARDAWHVVYARGGAIRYSVRDSSTWGTSIPLSSGTGTARDPHIASRPMFLGEQLVEPIVVVWQDDRSGHAEVWARRHDGSTWSPETCLTCDSAPSRAPVVTTHGYSFLVAWEEQLATRREIRARSFRDGAWQAVETVSLSTGDAFEPTVSVERMSGAHLAWTDTRHGAAELYYRNQWQLDGSWEPERRVTHSGAGSSRPSIHARVCCGGDLISPDDWTIRFEQQVAGVTECLEVTRDGVLGAASPLDTVQSERASGAVVTVPSGWGFTIAADLTLWTDAFAGGAHTSTLRAHPTGETHVITRTGLSHALMAASDREILTLWTELRDGVPTLLARVAELPFSGSVGDGAVHTPRLSLHPNPSRTGITFLMRDTAAGRTLRVLDAAGRQVYGQAAETSGRLRWDLRDARGRRVPPGRYTAVLDSGEPREVRSFVVLP